MDWELTDKEMSGAYEGEASKYPKSLGAPLYHGKRAVAKAAQKKLVEFLVKRSFVMQPADESAVVLIVCDWYSLCKSLGIKNED